MFPTLNELTKGQPRQRRKNVFIAPVGILVVLFLVGQAYWLSQNGYLFAPFALSKVDCDYCQKLGVVRDEQNPRIMKMCPVCFGVGHHQIRRFDKEDVLCSACGGMGRFDEQGVWRSCKRCDGRGLHRINDWKEIVDLEVMK